MNTVYSQGSRLVMTFLVTIVLTAMGWTQIDKNYKDNVTRATTDLIETVKVEGYINKRLMEDYLKVLSQRPVKLRLIHESGGFKEKKEIYVDYEILEAVFNTPEGTYKFKEGDYLLIQVNGRLFNRECVISRRGGHVEHEGYH